AEGVATVNAAGVITAVGEGTATITVSYGGQAATVTVTVTDEVEPEPEPEPEPIAVVGITVTGATEITSKGGNAQYVATVTPDTADNKAVDWSVESGTGEATITAAGMLTAVADGTVIVKAAAKDG